MALRVESVKLDIVHNEQPDQPEYSAPELKETAALSPELKKFSPNNPPWNSLAAVGVWIASVLLIAIFPVLFVIPYAAGKGPVMADQQEFLKFIRTDSTAILLQLIAVLPAHLMTLVIGWLVVTRFREYSFTEMLGWDWGGFKLWHNVPILVGFFGLAALMTTLLGTQENEMDRILKSSRYAVFVIAFFATFTAPLVEELVYRGILYSALQRTFGIAFAVVGVTVLFALVHVPQYSQEATPDYATLTVLLLLSLVLTLIRVKTDNLWPCVVLHTVFNGVQAVLLVLQPYLPVEPAAEPEKLGALWHLF